MPHGYRWDLGGVVSRRRMRGREQRRRRRRREQANRDPALVDSTPEWVDVGGRRMFVVGYTPGGAPYGCYEDEFDDGELSVTREVMALGPFLTSLELRLDELSAEQLRGCYWSMAPSSTPTATIAWAA